jgi:hypothetical protein
MKNAQKQHAKKIQHYFGNLTSSKDTICIAKKTQSQENYMQTENANTGVT